MKTQNRCSLAYTFLLLAAPPLSAQVLWTVGLDDNLWPVGDGGGPNTTFVQEAGVNPLPGNPNSPEVDAQADDDYYFAGSYTTAIDSVISLYGDYAPLGLVDLNEEAAERAFAGSDNEKRYHFNLPTTLLPTDLLSVTFDAFNLDTSGTDARYGVEVYFNGVLVQPEIIIRVPQLNVDYTSTQFSLASVNAVVGPGADNVVTLKGINYGGSGGGQWMGIDYVQLDKAIEVIPPAIFPWAVGLDDNAFPVGNGGGPNATFVQENGVTNELPGNPASPEVNQQADNDYYLAGSYTTVIASNGDYIPVGTVLANEEAAERTLSVGETELRYHCNLPNSLQPNSLIAVTFDASVLDMAGVDPRYGVEVYFNGILVQPEVIIRPAQLGKDFTTPQFTLSSVNAVIGSGFDNIVTLRGINYSASGGSNALGIDYLQLNPVTTPVPSPVLPWAAGLDDNSWPQGDGGAENASFVQGNGALNALPGSPISTETDGGADNDYYFAGYYTSLIAGNGTYDPVGAVPENEEAAERALTSAESELRYHFNLPVALTPEDTMTVTFDALSLDTGAADPRFGVEIYVNGVLVQSQIVIRPAQLGTGLETAPFTLASVNARVGAGFDNIVTLKGINYSATGGGNLLGIDYIKLNPKPPVVFPWTVGLDDNLWPAGNGGGPNATFVQENGAINPLPGNPNSPEVDQQADNDYYFAGVYSSVIAANGAYDPVGTVLINEEAAERAFAGGDLELRYHFNLPGTLLPTDNLAVSFDALNLHQDATTPDSRFGVEVYFNGVKVQDEVLIRPADLGTVYTTPGFSLASVGAEVGAGPDNIVSLRGISYNNEGGGNWMGVDSIQLNPVTPAPLPVLLPPTVSNGQVTLNWTGTGQLEWSTTLLNPWTPIIPAPVPPYSEPLVPGGKRFYRLSKP